MKPVRSLALLLAAAAPAFASAAVPDAGLGAQLQRLGYEAATDDNGDYRILFGLGKDAQGHERNQLTYVRSAIESYGSVKVREIWSVGYAGQQPELPARIANRLLADAYDSILGGWVNQGGTAAFVIKLSPDADDQTLADAIEAATRSADAMEAELTPGEDRF
ncbi:hypothetical protein [[Pseudomonas] boreopolis]|uniref:hypothetical protein n=1 Tax=Xanthomonas boreopolis TaxID=86183 RepID=UPI003D9BDAE1